MQKYAKFLNNFTNSQLLINFKDLIFNSQFSILNYFCILLSRSLLTGLI